MPLIDLFNKLAAFGSWIVIIHVRLHGIPYASADVDFDQAIVDRKIHILIIVAHGLFGNVESNALAFPGLESDFFKGCQRPNRTDALGHGIAEIALHDFVPGHVAGIMHGDFRVDARFRLRGENIAVPEAGIA